MIGGDVGSEVIAIVGVAVDTVTIDALGFVDTIGLVCISCSLVEGKFGVMVCVARVDVGAVVLETVCVDTPGGKDVDMSVVGVTFSNVVKLSGGSVSVILDTGVLKVELTDFVTVGAFDTVIVVAHNSEVVSCNDTVVGLENMGVVVASDRMLVGIPEVVTFGVTMIVGLGLVAISREVGIFFVTEIVEGVVAFRDVCSV